MHNARVSIDSNQVTRRTALGTAVAGIGTLALAACEPEKENPEPTPVPTKSEPTAEPTAEAAKTVLPRRIALSDKFKVEYPEFYAASAKAAKYIPKLTTGQAQVILASWAKRESGFQSIVSKEDPKNYGLFQLRGDFIQAGTWAHLGIKTIADALDPQKSTVAAAKLYNAATLDREVQADLASIESAALSAFPDGYIEAFHELAKDGLVTGPSLLPSSNAEVPLSR